MTVHPPLSPPAELAARTGRDGTGEDDSERRRRARLLTAEIDRVLREVTLATESWELHNLFQRARKLIRSEGLARQGARSQPPDMVERIRHLGRIWSNYRVAITTHPAETRRLLSGVAEYDDGLRALGLEDHELDGTPWMTSPRRTLLLLLEFLVVYLVLPPFLVIGVLVNLPTMLLLQALTKATAKRYKDEASIKLLVGAVAFPLTWLLVALLVAWGGSALAVAYPDIPSAPLLTGAVAFALSAFGGVLALQFRQIATETLRALRLRLTLRRRRSAVEGLLAQRSQLFDELLALDGVLSEE